MVLLLMFQKKFLFVEKNKHQLYQFFQDQGQASVKWNFYKTLVNQDATSFQTFNSVAKPEKGKLEESLKRMLK